MRGIRYLARLLANPGRELHVVDLVGLEQRDPADTTHVTEPGLRFRDSCDAGEMLDARAKEAYRRRLTEIEDDLEDARALGDASRVAQATAERDFLARELSRAVRQAMGRIHAQHPPLGAHLERAVRTGTYCAYLPDPRIPVAWKL